MVGGAGRDEPKTRAAKMKQEWYVHPTPAEVERLNLYKMWMKRDKNGGLAEIASGEVI